MAQNLREQITQSVIQTLGELTDPRPVLVTREPFQPDRLAITQFPALLVNVSSEERQTITMGAPSVALRESTITYNIRGYVRGEQLDRKRNDLIEAIEEALAVDRTRGLAHVMNSEVTSVSIVERQPPLAEIAVEYTVTYTYYRGTT